MSTLTDVILFIGSCWLLSLPVRLGALMLRRRSRARRRPGYIRRSLSAYGYASPATGAARATSTGCKPDGELRAEREARRMRRARSRTTARIASSSGTVIPLGGRTTGATGLSRRADLTIVQAWGIPGDPPA